MKQKAQFTKGICA